MKSINKPSHPHLHSTSPSLDETWDETKRLELHNIIYSGDPNVGSLTTSSIAFCLLLKQELFYS